MKITDAEKSEARAYLRLVAAELPDQRAVDGYHSAIMSGAAGFKDHIHFFIDALWALHEELIAWQEGSKDSDPERGEARLLLATTVWKFPVPITIRALVEREIYTEFDAFRHAFVDGEDEARRQVCAVIRAIHVLRDDLMAWGKGDLDQGEGDRGPRVFKDKMSTKERVER